MDDDTRVAMLAQIRRLKAKLLATQAEAGVGAGADAAADTALTKAAVPLGQFVPIAAAEAPIGSSYVPMLSRPRGGGFAHRGSYSTGGYRGRGRGHARVYSNLTYVAPQAEPDAVEKTGEPCSYFNKFGTCSRGDRCRFVHDPERVAICPAFLRNECQQANCPLSHKRDPRKLPVCSYFMRGLCTKTDCPYLHVNVARDAPHCPDFQQGFCPKGAQCMNLHTFNSRGDRGVKRPAPDNADAAPIPSASIQSASATGADEEQHEDTSAIIPSFISQLAAEAKTEGPKLDTQQTVDH